MNSLSPRTRSTCLLPISICKPGQPEEDSGRATAEATTCSKLSRTRSNRRSAKWSTNDSIAPLLPTTRIPRLLAISAGTDSGAPTAVRSTKWTSIGTAEMHRRATSFTRRLLPIPPVPVTVTSRVPSAINRSSDSSSSSRPRMGVRGSAGAVSRRSRSISDGRHRRGLEPFAEQQHQVVADQPSELIGRLKRAIAGRVVGLNPLQQGRQLGIPILSGLLHIEQAWEVGGEQVLVLQARDRLAGCHPPVALPIDPDEHVTLVQIRAVERPGRVGSSPDFEHHRRQREVRDRGTHGRSLLAELSQRRAHEHPQALIRRQDQCRAPSALGWNPSPAPAQYRKSRQSRP